MISPWYTCSARRPTQKPLNRLQDVMMYNNDGYHYQIWPFKAQEFRHSTRVCTTEVHFSNHKTHNLGETARPGIKKERPRRLPDLWRGSPNGCSGSFYRMVWMDRKRSTIKITCVSTRSQTYICSSLTSYPIPPVTESYTSW